MQKSKKGDLQELKNGGSLPRRGSDTYFRIGNQFWSMQILNYNMCSSMLF